MAAITIISLSDEGLIEVLANSPIWDEIGELVVRKAKEHIESSSPSGRVYHRSGGAYQASAPGEPPAILSGRLIEGLYYEVSVDPLELGVTIYDDAPEALFTEVGTSKIEPRPFIRPAVDEALQELGLGFDFNVAEL